MLDMYQITGDSDYMDNAYYHAAGILDYAVRDGNGVAFPGDSLFRVCADFGMGTSGIGLFLHRLVNPQVARPWFPDLMKLNRLEKPMERQRSEVIAVN